MANKQASFNWLGLFTRFWGQYTALIKQNCEIEPTSVRNMQYWRNNLFAGTMIYLFPFSLIGLIPGLYWSAHTNNWLLVLIDIIIFLLVSALALLPGIKTTIRKLIFIVLAYLLGCILIYVIGLSGPGLIYLLAACTFSVLIFHVRYSYLPTIANSVICIAFAIAIPMAYLPWPRDINNSLGGWIAVSSNLVFLSFLSSALIPRLFDGLHRTIIVEKDLKKQLSEEQESLRKSVELLEQKNSELEQFAYIASHDLQEPLRMITSFLHQLESKYDSVLDEKGRKYIYFAVDGAKRMRQIILDLLNYSRAGRTEAKLESIDLNLLVKDILIFFKNRIEVNKAKLIVQDLPVIRCYVVPVRQLFQNLLDNSLKYIKDGRQPEIRISSIEHEHAWEFIVSDNGIGIPEEFFERIFIIFKRLHTNEEYSGTGMGLALCKKITESFGGKIWVESQMDSGSAFHFTIPKDPID